MKPTAESVKVVVRCRPINEKEIQDGHTRIVQVWTDRGVIEIHNPKGQAADPPKPFTFDSVYDWNCHQIDIYEETFRPLVDSVLQGYNGTIFAYGQTGTGKTYTMEGIKECPEKRGLIPNSFEHIFSHISQSRNTQFLVRASYLEIYQEHIRDLLAKDQKKRLELKERPDTGVYVKDLSSFVCKSVKEIDHVMNVGNQNRSVGATNMNEHSSRSHAIFIVTVEACDLQNHGQSQGGRVPIRVGKLNLVDLAGSERQAKTGATGDRLKEATKINLSLSALGNVISALVDGKSSHIPYRDSKLTRLLQDSLGGNSRTVMVANVGPASYNYEETLTTLRYAHRAKSIKNAPHINEDPKDALLREFQQEIARLKAHVADKKKKRGRRRKRHKGGDELDEAEETEETEEEDEKDVEKDIREQEAKLEAERAAIVGNEQLITEEKERLLKALQEKELELQKQRQNQEKLASRIKALESKLLMGGVNMDLEGDNSKSIIEHTNEQQRALEQRRQEIMERKRLEREIQQKLEAQEEETSDLRETFGSLQQEVDVKTKKLKKLYAKWQAARQDVADLSDEFARERRELEEAQEALTKELKLKYLIMDNFIPPAFRHQIVSRAYFDEDEDAFKLRPFSQSSAHPLPRPKATAQVPRPSTEYERLMIQSPLTPSELYRFKAENVLVLELDLPTPTTGPYVAPTVSPSLQEALHRAMEAHSTPMEVGCHSAPAVKDVRAFLKSAASKQRRAATARSRSAHSSRHGHAPLQPHHPQSDTPDGVITFARMYPQPRGLVPK